MKVLVATTAGAGHFGPLVPFARALSNAGHDVMVAAPHSAAPTITCAGFATRSVGDIPPEAFGPREQKSSKGFTRSVFAGTAGMSLLDSNLHFVREVFGRLGLAARLDDTRRIVDEWHPDLVLREQCEIASFVAAEAAGVPQAQVAIGLSSFEEIATPVLAEAISNFGLTECLPRLQSIPRLSHVPPSFEVASALPGTTARFRWDDPADDGVHLPDWWKSTAPLVYVTFGSEAGGMDFFPRVYRAVLDQLATMPIRVLMTVGRSADPALLGTLPANAHVECWWPQAGVMKEASAVVGHGGYGTTMTALAAGLPQILIPLFSMDQHDNARRLNEIGAGVSLPEGPAALGGLADALSRVLEDQSYSDKARRIAAEIAALPPPAEAVGLLESLAQR
jgi:UDP:flavonoid glycosyltransferase YjiC (YdhE family)